jgi:hypothetical protein
MVQQNGGLPLLYVTDSQVFQVGRAHGHGGTIVHVINEDVDPASNMFVWDSAFPHNIDQGGVFVESGKATDLPRRSRSVRNLQLFWNRLAVIGSGRECCCLASADHRLLP